MQKNRHSPELIEPALGKARARGSRTLGWAVGGGRWAVGSGQWAVGSGQWVVGTALLSE